MLTFLLEIHFWTFNDEISISSNDFGVFRYHSKKENAKSWTYEKKKSFVTQREYQWSLSNKKPSKLRQNVQELETLLSDHRLICLKWLKEDLIVLFLNSGTAVYIEINLSSGDISNVYFDKIFKDKLLSLHISDFLITNIFSMCCYNDLQLTLIHYIKPCFTKVHKKISDLDPRFISVHLPGPNGRRLPRKLSINKNGDVVAVWWKYSEDDVFPWSPLVKDIDRANVHIYVVNGSNAELICYHRTEHSILDLTFSAIDSHIVYLVEEKRYRDGEMYIEISSFEIIKSSRLQRTSLITIPVQCKVNCLRFSPDRSNLLLGCSNGTVMLYNQARALTHIVRTTFVPSIIRWHADGCVVVVASAKGQLQCFDFALGAIKIQSINEDVTPSNVIDLSVYFSHSTSLQPPSLSEMEWGLKGTRTENSTYEDGFLLISFLNGPMIIMKVLSAISVTAEFLVDQYLKGNQIDKAINILLAMDWDTSPSSCCDLLARISNYALNSSTFSPVEKFSQIQMALSSFLSPVRPISHSIETEYYKPVRNISRRLFHYLLRYNLYDLAMNVATQVNEHDLFMDLYYCAKNNDNSILATTAWEKAEQILAEKIANRLSESDDDDSDCSCSNCSCSEECVRIPVRKLEIKQPSIAVGIPSAKASFATITRVNSTRSLNVSLVTNEEIQSTHENCSENQNLISNNRDASCSVAQVNLQCQNTSKDLSELLQQTGMSDSNITESKSIKVVHFGVV